MRKLLIVGGGRLQVPAYLVGRRLGFHVVGVDRDRSAPGLGLADVSYAVDTRDVASVVEIARRERIDAVTTLCTDAPVVTVAAVGESLGIAAISPSAAANATNKIRMRRRFASAGVPIPRFEEVSSETEAYDALRRIGLPAILKPPSSSGSRGVFEIRDLRDVPRGFRHAAAFSGKGPLLLEECVQGPEVSVETLTFSGKHHIIQITDKRTSGPPNWVETGHVQPSRMGAETLDAVARLAVQALDALGVELSAGHVEIKIGNDGPKVIEVGARLGGDFITTELVPRSTGVDMVEAIVKISAGEEPQVTPSRLGGAAVRFLVLPRGRVASIESISGISELPGVARVELDAREGDLIAEVRSSGERHGFVICEGPTAAIAEMRAELALAELLGAVEVVRESN